MNGKMIISNSYNQKFRVVGLDEEGKGWSCKFFDTKSDAIESTKELLKDYNKEYYDIVDNAD
jgi:hypothetical protein